MHKKHPQTVIRLRMFWYTEYIGGKYLVPLVKGDSPIRGNVRNADKGVAVSGEEDVTAYAVTGGFRRATRDRVPDDLYTAISRHHGRTGAACRAAPANCCVFPHIGGKRLVPLV